MRPVKSNDENVDNRLMRSSVVTLSLLLVLSACTGSTEDAGSPDPAGTGVPSTQAASVPEPSDASETRAPADARADETSGLPGEVDGPEYDVFLAALDSALEGTRFEETVFEDPEVVASSGLLLCERLDAGLSQEEVVVEYLAELTDGDVERADDDQLTLAGALVGAAVEALCPQHATE